MNILGYILTALGIWMFISALRHATRRDFVEEHGTEKGKKYAAKLRVFAVGSRIVIGIILLLVGLWMLGVFR